MENTFDPTARARYLGGRLQIRDLEGWQTLATSPLTFAGRVRGFFVVFRFGAVVGVGTDPADMQEMEEVLREKVVDPTPTRGEERALIRIIDEGREGIGPDGEILLRELDAARAQVVANVLAKSAALGHYEEEVAKVFDHVEGLAIKLRDGAGPASGRELLKQIGNSLLIQTHMVGRVEVSEKPEHTWEEPELDRLYLGIAHEYELADRDRALSRKLELISDVAGTYLELVDTRKSLRVEWYIVILIVVEIVFLLWWELAA